MSVKSTTTGSPASPATASRLSASAVALLERRQEGAGADLDVHDERVEPGRELLRQDRRRDERQRVDRRRDVADRVEPPVGGREIRRLADDGAAGVAHGARGSGARSGAVSYPGMLASLSSVPPVCPSPRPEIIGTKAPQAATTGARMRLTLSPTPPVECLSRTGPPRSARDQSSTAARARHGAREGGALPPRQAAEVHGHGEGGDLALAHGPIDEPLDDARDLRLVRVAPSRLRRISSAGECQGAR